MTMPSLPTANPEDVGLSSAALDRLSAALQERVAAGHVPGAVALVARHGKIAYHRSFGVLDPASGAPMRDNAIFRIYSMTKPIVSVAVMMLWEQGRLQLGREPRPLPQLVLKDRGQGLSGYEPEDFAFENYDPHPHIAAPVAV